MASIVHLAPVMRRILEQSPFLDTVALGASSERTKQLLTHKCPVMKDVQVNIREAIMSVGGTCAAFPSLDYRFVDGQLANPSQTVNINGNVVAFRDGFGSKAHSENNVQAVHDLGELVASMFLPRELTVQIDRKLFDDVASVSGWRQWKHVAVADFCVNGDLSPAELEQVLSNVTPREQLRLTVTCPNLTDEVAGFELDSVILSGRSEWFGRKTLFESNCRHLSVEFPALSFKDINMFLREWVGGRYEKLAHLQFFFEVEKWEKEKSDLLAGIEFVAVEKPVEDESEIIKEFDWHLMSHDGKHGTMNKDEHTLLDVNTVVLTFEVGKDSFPVIQDKVLFYW